MKRFIVGLGVVVLIGISGVAFSAEREVYVEAGHILDVNNFEIGTSDIQLTGVYRNSFWKGIGIDFRVTGNTADSYEKTQITIGPRYAKGDFEASITSGFLVDNVDGFGDTAYARIRYTF